MQWFISNWSAILSIVSMGLAMSIAILQLFHKTSVVASLQNIEDMIDKLNKPAPIAEVAQNSPETPAK